MGRLNNCTHTHMRSDEFAIGVHLLFPPIPRVFMNLLPYVPFQFFCFVYKYFFFRAIILEFKGGLRGFQD
jgi:hypothetical protein